MQQAEVLKAFWLAGRYCAPGETVSLCASDFRYLVATGKVSAASTPKKKRN